MIRKSIFLLLMLPEQNCGFCTAVPILNILNSVVTFFLSNLFIFSNTLNILFEHLLIAYSLFFRMHAYRICCEWNKQCEHNNNGTEI